ncbi:DNA internalization-related competence protein ComEC/Rec2 [Pseudomonas sp. KNUC1026]|nr:DNA internalization-related competence protein ComEC/Rec2 [Pseudomonas sp. KNUC1026]UFH50215.1 DNA internalization-related competence protein ComEC/Rec2 [Pseudomonas sp. KNUC1026]
MAALAAGLLALRWLPALPTGWMLGLGALLAVVCLWRGHWLPGWFLAGLCWACLSAQWALDERLPPALHGETFWLEGRVTGLPREDGRSVRFELRDVSARRAELPTRLRLSWFAGPPVRDGERWRLAVTLREPRGLVNPGGFDQEAWLLAQRIGAQGSVKDGQRLQAATSWQWRERLAERLLAVPAQGYEAVIAALVLGDSRGLKPEQWQMLQATGTVHLLVISGQHIGVFAGLLYGLVAGLARLGLWPARWPWLPCACLASMAGALGYGALAGFGVPVQRACLILAWVLLWRLTYRRPSLGLPLLGALCGVLLAEPLASLRQGFWLSFAAVAILLLGFSGRLGGWPLWQAWLRPQWLTAIGLAPWLVALGLPVSVSGPLANLFAVPWVSLVVLPGALAGTALLLVWPWAGQGLLIGVGHALALLFGALEHLAGLAAPLEVPAPPGWAWPLIALGVLWWLAPAGVPLRWLGLPLMALLFWAPRPAPPHGEAWVTQLDVGQGLAVLVRTRDHALLYDAGPTLGGSDAGQQVVVPSLRQLGVRRLDGLLISHGHLDHAGGATSVLKALPTGWRRAGDPHTLPEGYDPCESGAQWDWNGVRFSQWRWQAAKEGNLASCVLLIEAGEQRLLLPGDLELPGEQALLRERPDWRAEWLQAPHHGSKTSSSAALLDGLGVRQVMIPRGSANRFGHPHPQVLARYTARGIQIHDTAVHGALWLRLGSTEPPERWRERPRFWRLP